jgi:hypothetical protein
MLTENEELFEEIQVFNMIMFLKNIKQFVKIVYVKENLETT